jgi:hypothetical protein
MIGRFVRYSQILHAVICGLLGLDCLEAVSAYADVLVVS